MEKKLFWQKGPMNDLKFSSLAPFHISANGDKNCANGDSLAPMAMDGDLSPLMIVIRVVGDRCWWP